MHQTVFTHCKALAQAERAGVKTCSHCGATKSVGHIKQQGRPAYYTTLSPLNQTRLDTRTGLTQQLGRPPTHDEMHAAMLPQKQFAAWTGWPLTAIHPDNPPSGDSYPGTMDNPTFDKWIDTWTPPTLPGARGRSGPAPGNPFGQPPIVTPADKKRIENMVRSVDAEPSFDWSDPVGRFVQHPIDPNAKIRKANPESLHPPGSLPFYMTIQPQNGQPSYNVYSPNPNIDPRKPEVYNALLPADKQMTQDQMDQIRRAYYTANPDLIPRPGMPGYGAWRAQGMRGR